MTFELFAFRFHFQAVDFVRFPAGQPANILRGALGTILRKLACAPDCTSARTCESRAACPYARIFEPSSTAQGPSGLADWPRPFVFRAGHLEGRTVEPGESFHFDVHLFYLRQTELPYLVLAFAELSREGLGPGRGRAQLADVGQLNVARQPGARVFDGAAFLEKAVQPPISLSLEPEGRDIHRLLVRFVTPVELKSGQKLADRPEFGVLFPRIRDRLSTLRALYGPGPLEIDFRAMGERAAHVRMTRCEIQQRSGVRRSSRTGQVHPLGGFVGEAEYEGDLTEFLPYLRAAEWTGVGRQTVWGKGEIAIGGVKGAGAACFDPATGRTA